MLGDFKTRKEGNLITRIIWQVKYDSDMNTVRCLEADPWEVQIKCSFKYEGAYMNHRKINYSLTDWVLLVSRDMLLFIAVISVSIRNWNITENVQAWRRERDTWEGAFVYWVELVYLIECSLLREESNHVISALALHFMSMLTHIMRHDQAWNTVEIRETD